MTKAAEGVLTVHLTFYDTLEVRPYTTTLYVRVDARPAQIEALVQAVQGLSRCMLGQYRAGGQTVEMPDYVEQVRAMQHSVEGTAKWRVKVFDDRGNAQSFSIPGRDRTTERKVTRGERFPVGELPDIEHLHWQQLRAVLSEIGTTKAGQPLTDRMEGNVYVGKWPPKGWKKRKTKR